MALAAPPFTLGQIYGVELGLVYSANIQTVNAEWYDWKIVQIPENQAIHTLCITNAIYLDLKYIYGNMMSN